MPLEVALGQPRASQRNSSTTEAESAFVNSPEGNLLLNYWGERYRAPAGDEIGALTGIEFNGNALQGGRRAEPPRRRVGQGRHADGRAQSVSTGSRERASSTTASASASCVDAEVAGGDRGHAHLVDARALDVARRVADHDRPLARPRRVRGARARDPRQLAAILVV